MNVSVRFPVTGTELGQLHRCTLYVWGEIHAIPQVPPPPPPLLLLLCLGKVAVYN